MSNGLQYFDISIPANGSRQIDAEGRYFRFYAGISTSPDVDILVKGDTGAVVSILAPGQSLKLDKTVKSWSIANRKNTGTITGIVVIGDGELTDSTISGTVNAVNGELVRVKAGMCFMASATFPATAGQYSHVQLDNALAGTKRCVINKLHMMTSAPSGTQLNQTTIVSTGGLTLGKNKVQGGPAGTVGVRAEGNVAILGTTWAMMGVSIAFDSKEFPFSEPIILLPGQRLNAVATQVNTTMSAIFQWYEEDL